MTSLNRARLAAVRRTLLASLVVIGACGDATVYTGGQRAADSRRADAGRADLASDADAARDAAHDSASPDLGASDTPVGRDLDVANAPDASDVSLSADAPDISASDSTDEPDAAGEPDAGPSGTPPLLPVLSDSRVTALRSQLDGILSDASVAGRRLTALVVEAESGRVLYEQNPDSPLTPASNTKLFTTASALALLGEDYRFETRVFASSPPNAAGAVSDLYLVSHHDFTFSTYFHETDRTPMDELAARVYAAGVRSVSGRAWIYGELGYSAQPLSTYSASAHRATAATAWRQALQAAGITVASSDVSASFEPPVGSTLLASRLSVPLYVACGPINNTSHNEFADILMRHIGWVRRGASSYEAGGAEVRAWLEGTGVDATGFTLSDGSGLSYANRVSARQVVDLQRYMAGHPSGAEWLRSFSVSGLRGTLSGRLTGADTSGRVFGKTGTLAITIATSGTLENRNDGRHYVFALIMNDQPSQTAARTVQDRAVAALGVDLLGAGARPPRPELQLVRGGPRGRLIETQWTPSPGAAGYWVWRSADGDVWHREDAVYTDATGAFVAPFVAGEPLYVRVTAVAAAGESDPSAIYAACAAADTDPILLVDGFERFWRQPIPENPRGAASYLMARYADALSLSPSSSRCDFDTAAAAAVRARAIALPDYDAVLWAAGEESTTDEVFSSAEQALLDELVASGGGLFVSGAEVAYDLVATGEGSDAAWLGGTLRVGYAGDDAGTFRARGSGGAFAELGEIGFFTPSEVVVSYPDQLTAVNGGVAAMSYAGGSGGVAAVQYAGTYRALVLGFPLESVAAIEERAAILEAALTFLR